MFDLENGVSETGFKYKLAAQASASANHFKECTCLRIELVYLHLRKKLCRSKPFRAGPAEFVKSTLALTNAFNKLASATALVLLGRCVDFDS